MQNKKIFNLNTIKKHTLINKTHPSDLKKIWRKINLKLNNEINKTRFLRKIKPLPQIKPKNNCFAKRSVLLLLFNYLNKIVLVSNSD